MKTNRSQTATEYLIILAVVIIIGLIVVAALGGIPGIGSGTGSRGDSAELATLPVGVSSHSMGSNYATVQIRNNEPVTVRVETVTVGPNTCTLNPPVILLPGESQLVGCEGTESFGPQGARYEHDLTMNYTIEGISFSSTGVLTGTVADEIAEVPDAPGASPIVGLSSGYSAMVCGGESGVVDPASCDIEPHESLEGNHFVALSSNNGPVAIFHVDFNENLDWTGLTGGSNPSQGKAFIHHADGYVGTGIDSENIILLIPLSGDNTYWICPNAETLEAVVPQCPGGNQPYSPGDSEIISEGGYYHASVHATGGAELVWYGSSGANSVPAMTHGWGFRW